MKMKYLIPGIPLFLRLFLFAILQITGIMLHYSFYGMSALGLLVMLGGGVLLWAKNFKNKPADLGFEEWTAVSGEEYQRILDNMKQTKSRKQPFFFSRAWGYGILWVAGMVAFFLFTMEMELRILLVVLQALIIIMPVALSGVFQVWYPREIALKLPCFEALVQAATQRKDPSITLVPYLRFDKDKAGRRIPEDLRLMVELHRGPEDFIGVQFQAAINNGPNGAVPYCYAVFLTRGLGTTYIKLTAKLKTAYVMEAGGNEEYGTLVMRQKTGGGGYKTSPKDCQRLYESVMDLIKNRLQ
jgi:hypothetical protein